MGEGGRLWKEGLVPGGGKLTSQEIGKSFVSGDR